MQTYSGCVCVCVCAVERSLRFGVVVVPELSCLDRFGAAVFLFFSCHSPFGRNVCDLCACVSYAISIGRQTQPTAFIRDEPTEKRLKRLWIFQRIPSAASACWRRRKKILYISTKKLEHAHVPTTFFDSSARRTDDAMEVRFFSKIINVVSFFCSRFSLFVGGAGAGECRKHWEMRATTIRYSISHEFWFNSLEMHFLNGHFVSA